MSFKLHRLSVPEIQQKIIAEKYLSKMILNKNNLHNDDLINNNLFVKDLNNIINYKIR